jgi:GNAT superfamily N-acetyltransferase
MSASAKDLTAVDGYRPGAIADIIKLHMDYYDSAWNFGAPFECGLAKGLGDFLAGYSSRKDFLRCIRDAHGSLLAVIAVSGRDSFPAARIRWFIVADRAQGRGLGRQLLDAALVFCRDAGFKSAWLTTFQGLDAARSLYLGAGFALVAESDADEWSGDVREQRYEVRF